MLIALKKDDEIVVASTIAGSFVDTSKKDLALADNIPFWKVKGVKDCYVFAEDLTFTTDLLRYNDYVFKATGSILIFDGYLKVYGNYESSEDVVLPDLEGVTVLTADEVLSEQHFTKPAPRFTESTLIKELEKLGIGRPSTYATIMETIKARDYVTVEDKKFVPTKVGIETTDKLQEGFSDIINVEYTADMETDLDEIAESKLDNVELFTIFPANS